MSNLKSLLSNENVTADCTGRNYNVYVTPSKLLVEKRFTLGDSYVNVPHANISSLELITKSLLPPLTFSLVATIGGFLVWWFPGQAKLSPPPFPYNIALFACAAFFLGGIASLWWRRRVATLRIGIVGSKDPITIRMVDVSKAENVFRALKG